MCQPETVLADGNARVPHFAGHAACCAGRSGAELEGELSGGGASLGDAHGASIGVLAAGVATVASHVRAAGSASPRAGSAAVALDAAASRQDAGSPAGYADGPELEDGELPGSLPESPAPAERVEGRADSSARLLRRRAGAPGTCA